MAAIPTPDLAVPYEAPKQVKTMAQVQPMAPKKGCQKQLAELVIDAQRLSPCRPWVEMASDVGRSGGWGDSTNRVDGAVEAHCQLGSSSILVGTRWMSATGKPSDAGSFK